MHKATEHIRSPIYRFINLVKAFFAMIGNYPCTLVVGKLVTWSILSSYENVHVALTF